MYENLDVNTSVYHHISLLAWMFVIMIIELQLVKSVVVGVSNRSYRPVAPVEVCINYCRPPLIPVVHPAHLLQCNYCACSMKCDSECKCHMADGLWNYHRSDEEQTVDWSWDTLDIYMSTGISNRYLLIWYWFNRLLLCHVVYFPLFINIESASKSGKPNMHTVQFLNLAYISNVQLVNEAPDAQPSPLPNLNYSKV